MPLRKVVDFDRELVCMHPDHNPPSHIVLSPGVYEHTCPSCGKVTRFIVYGVTC